MRIMALFQIHFLQNACEWVRITVGGGHLCHIDTFLFLFHLFCSVSRVRDENSSILGSGMKATAALPSRAEKAVPGIAFSSPCSNEFKILISFNLILSYM